MTVCDRGREGVKFGQKKCDIFFEWPLTDFVGIYTDIPPPCRYAPANIIVSPAAVCSNCLATYKQIFAC